MTARSRRGAVAVAIGAIAIALLAGSSGVDWGHLEEVATTPRCKTPYEVLNAQTQYPSEEIDQAVDDSRFRVHLEERSLRPPVNWLQDPYGSQAFRSNLTNLQWLGPLFAAYRERADVDALKQARDLVLDWVRQQPYQGAETSDQAWQEKEVADRAPVIAYLLRVASCEHLLSSGQKEALLHSALQHASILTDPAFYPTSNHGLFADAGLALLSDQLRFRKEADDWRELANQRFENTFIDRVFPNEGLWLEPSAGYHMLAIGLLQKYLAIPGAGSPRLEALLPKMQDVAGWLVEPDRRLVQIGDTDIDRPAHEAVVRGRNDNGLLWLPESGLAVVKVPRQSYLSVSSSFFTNDHKHSDDLSFDLYDHGNRIVSDTGLYDKDPGPYYEFEHAARAHSTLTVDDRDFPRVDAYRYGSGLVAHGSGDGWYAIEATNPLVASAQGVDHTRLFLYKPGVALIVVDQVQSAIGHTYQRYFQLGPEITTEPDGDALGLTASDLDGALYSESSQGPEKPTETRGRDDPLGGYTFPAFREQAPRSTIEYRSDGAGVSYVTTFSLDGPDIRAHLDGPQPLERLTIAHGDEGETQLLLSREGDRIHVEER